MKAMQMWTLKGGSIKMSEEFGLEELEYIRSGGATDDEMDKLDGSRVKIASIEVIDDTSTYKDGKALPEGMEIEVKKLLLTTEPFGKELIGRDITHKEKYNLKEKDGKWIVSLHEKSKTAQFLSKYKIDNFKNAKGKEVVISKKTNPDNKRSYLTISV